MLNNSFQRFTQNGSQKVAFEINKNSSASSMVDESGSGSEGVVCHGYLMTRWSARSLRKILISSVLEGLIQIIFSSPSVSKDARKFIEPLVGKWF